MGRRVHLIGIGGSGLSSIATLLHERGLVVSGSDQADSVVTQRLRQLGMNIAIGHRAENVAGADLVLRSSAVLDHNIEVSAARIAGIPVIKREDFLPELIGTRKSVAVAGTHGKTTTTALIAWLLTEMNADPSYIIGGYSPNLRGSAHAGNSDLFVIEADEYDRMFLGLTPWIALVTNVEHDHPDCYPTELDFQTAFEAFTDRLVAEGALLACEDDPGAARLLDKVRASGRRSYGYSLNNQQSDFYAGSVRLNNEGGFSFSLYVNGVRAVDEVKLRIPGVHNVSNALGALGVIHLLGLSLEAAARLCQSFIGTGRRFEIRGEPDQILLIDDYAHHPTEIRATLSAARQLYPGRRIWVVWQPHTYSRTRTLLSDYQNAFKDADKVIVTEIYAAREQQPDDGFSGLRVAESLAGSSVEKAAAILYFAALSEAADHLTNHLIPGDVLLVLSAGNADWINSRLMETLGKRSTGLIIQ